ncbi:MAG: DUF4199 domain-containing protein [Vicingaceae bacterium]
MENFEENNRPSKVKSALNFGAILGLALAVISLITYILEMYSSSWIGWLGNIILILGVVWGIKRYRDEELGGFISYGQGVGYGTLIGLFAGIIISFVTYIYLNFVDDGMIQFILGEQEKSLYESGMSAEQTETMLKTTKMMTSPGAIAVFGVIGQVFFAFITSLIAMAFLKKDADAFQDSI